jgi:universal stress protein A
MPKRILVPTDCSETSLAAVDHAAELARGSDAKIILLHVIEVARPTRSAGGESATAASRDLEEIARRLRRRGADVEVRLLTGAPGIEILRAIENERADTVVMGTHGRTGFRKVLMGSVAEKIAREARCPVVTVRAQPRVGKKK